MIEAIRLESGSSGKGLTPAAALVSGAWKRSRSTPPRPWRSRRFAASYQDLARDNLVSAIDDLPLRRHGIFHPHWPLPWHLGSDLLSQTEFAVPLATVRFDADPNSLDAFQTSSNGFGAGNSLPEAIAAALYGVIERDAVARDRAASVTGRATPLHDDATLCSFSFVGDLARPVCRGRGSAAREKGTVDTGVPTCKAWTVWAASGGYVLVSDVRMGYPPHIRLG